MKVYGYEIKEAIMHTYEQNWDKIDTSVHGGRNEILPRILCRRLEAENDRVW